ncbi:MAG: cytochrome c biogenesis protein ResB [Elusimicrobiota bacterium]
MRTSILSTLKHLAASPASSLALIVGSATAIVAGYLAPRQDLYGSGWFWGLGALAASLLAYTVLLQARALARRRSGACAPRPEEAAAIAAFAEKGWRLATSAGNESSRTLVFDKNREGRWGSLIFHAGLLLLVLGGLAQSLFQNRGFAQLMEGEVFLGREGDFLQTEKGPWAGPLEPPFGLRLDALRRELWDDNNLKALESSLSVLREGAAKPVSVAINFPLRDSGFAVYQSPYYGSAVSLELTRADGRRLVTHFLLDHAARPDQPERGGSDFPTTDYLFSLNLRPGRREVEVFQAGRSVYAGPLTDKAPVALGLDRLILADIKPWSGFNVVDQRGLWALGLGFVATTLGALLLFARPHRELSARRDARGAWVVSAAGRREKALLNEEAERIMVGLSVGAPTRSREHASA